jgi:hypothetical protein
MAGGKVNYLGYFPHIMRRDITSIGKSISSERRKKDSLES